MIIDFHTHFFPDKIAQKAIPMLSKYSGGITPCTLGTAESSKEILKKSGVEKAVLLSVATNPKQQKNVNDFAVSLISDSMIIPFGSVHPDSEEIFDELKRLKNAGIKGIKLHPDYQNFFVDEDRMIPIYKKIAEMGFITVFHSGIDIGFPEPVHCTPERLSHILDAFDGAPVVAAHLGGYLMYEDTLKYLCSKDVYIDTSFSCGKVPPYYAKQIIANHPCDRVLFGTDMPWSSPEDELSFIDSLELNAGDRDAILYKNAKYILNL